MTKVLYVEDNDDNVYMLKMRLELLGDFEVLTAEDGEKGCEKAVSERPDIILMDLQMPVMDGWEAARRLKSIPETSDIPIIGLSAHALAGERDKALGAGCDEFDTKAHRVRASCCDDPAALRDAIGSNGRLIRNVPQVLCQWGKADATRRSSNHRK